MAASDVVAALVDGVTLALGSGFSSPEQAVRSRSVSAPAVSFLMLTAHQCAVEATQVHGHYLKGTIHCGQCGSRLIVSNAKNRHGNVYCYFVCSGRH